MTISQAQEGGQEKLGLFDDPSLPPVTKTGLFVQLVQCDDTENPWQHLAII